MMWRSWLGVPVLVGVLMFGCGGNPASEESHPSPSAPAEKVKVDRQEGKEGYTVHVQSGSEELKFQTEEAGESSFTMEVTSKEGEIKMSAGSAARLPEGLPSDVPTYPGMTLTLSQSMKENETFNLMATTSDLFGKVGAHFKAETTAKGWTQTNYQEQSEDARPSSVYVGSKEGRILTILLTTEEQGTSIAITTARQ